MDEDKGATEGAAAQQRGAQAKSAEISKESIEALGEKLDEFADHLSPDDQLTLATAFALAGRGLSTFVASVSCAGDIRVGIGRGAIAIETISGATPKLSHALADAFCAAGAKRFSIDGLEVERTMVGSKSVAAGAKSVAAGAKSVAAGTCMPGWGGGMRPWTCQAGAKSVAAGLGRGCLGGAKSVAAGVGCRGAKSVAAGAACRGAKSVAAGMGCRGAKSVAAGAGCRGAKSVAAGMGCRGAKSVAAGAGLGCYGAKSVAAGPQQWWR
jgi:hypothetical protein